MPMYLRTPSPPLEAIQWTGDNADDVIAFAGSADLVRFVDIAIHTVLTISCGPGGAQGFVPVPHGDWVAKGTNPEHLYPIDDNYFRTHFVPMEAAT